MARRRGPPTLKPVGGGREVAPIASVRSDPRPGPPGFAPFVATGVVVLVLNRDAVVPWPDRLVANHAGWLWRCRGLCVFGWQSRRPHSHAG